MHPTMVEIPVDQYREMLAELKYLRGDISELKAKMPIWKETGGLNNPDSRIPVIVYSKQYGTGTGYWDDGCGWIFFNKYGNPIQTDSITHWMPYPSEP